MPTIDVDYSEFERMLGIALNKNQERIDEILAFAKAELKIFDEKTGMMSVEIKDTNRADLWNVEGLVRCLRGFLGLESGLRQYLASEPVCEVGVDSRLKSIRPYIACSVVKDLELPDPIIRGLVQLQDKLDHTYGRNRRRTSIGLYDFDQIAAPLSYTVAKPDDVTFVPLGFDVRMSLREILGEHPKGLEYGAIVSGHSVWPILLDAEGKVLSFPPIINSNDLGRVTEATRNVLVEVTGTVDETVLNTLTIVSLSLVDRGGRACSVTVQYPGGRSVVTPRFDSKSMGLSVDYANKVLGLKLSGEQVGRLLPKAGYRVEKTGRSVVRVRVPCYRIDIMHEVDLVEDVAIAYGYNKIRPLWRKLPTVGSVRTEQGLLDVARELMVGLGFQEVLTYTMTNPEMLFAKMNLKTQAEAAKMGLGPAVEVANPKVQTLTCLRSWLLPCLMDFLGCNLHVEYPQRVFELGKVTVHDGKAETKTRDVDTLAAVSCHGCAGFSEAKSFLDAFFMNLGLLWQVRQAKHGSFIHGRFGRVIVEGVDVGFVGEIHPGVLEAWGLENPVAGFELNMGRIVGIISRNL
jgi:phenylalanyl-tRNA synthetase beta chain